MGLSYDDLVDIPEKVLKWVRDKLKDIVTTIIKKLGLCACITNIGLLRSGVTVVRELGGMDATVAKLKGAASAADAGLTDVSKIAFAADVLKEVVDSVGDVLTAVAEFLKAAAAKVAADVVEDGERLIKGARDFMKFLDGGFAFALPKFELDDLKDFFCKIGSIIPKPLLDAPFALFDFLCEMADETVKTFANGAMALLAIAMPVKAVKEGIYEKLKAAVKESDDICLLSLIGLLRIGNKLESKEEDVLNTFDAVVDDGDASSVKKAAAGVAKVCLKALEFVEDGLEDLDDALSDVGSAVGDAVDDVKGFVGKLF